MVKSIRRLLLTAAALTCLAACNLGVGIFPDRLTSYEAYADLTRFIDPHHVGDFNFKIIRDSTSGIEYLVLANDDDSFGGDHVVVFNNDLKALGHFSLDELNAMDAGAPFEGTGAMVDVNGLIVVGNRRFTVSPHKVSYLDTPPTLGAQGLAVGDTADRNLANIRGDAQNLKFGRYDADWALIGPVIWQIGTSSWHDIVGSWLTDTEVLLVVRHDPDPTDTAHVLAMDKVLFATGVPCEPLRGTYTGGIVPSNDIEWRTLGYTNEGFAAYRWTSNQYYRFDESGVELGTPLDVPEGKRPYNQRHVYGRTSGWYILDMDEISIERRAWWWK
jgi:hypothetical protein